MNSTNSEIMRIQNPENTKIISNLLKAHPHRIFKSFNCSDHNKYLYNLKYYINYSISMKENQKYISREIANSTWEHDTQINDFLNKDMLNEILKGKSNTFIYGLKDSIYKDISIMLKGLVTIAPAFISINEELIPAFKVKHLGTKKGMADRHVFDHLIELMEQKLWEASDITGCRIVMIEIENKDVETFERWFYSKLKPETFSTNVVMVKRI